MTDWRDELAAARLPVTAEQAKWDRQFGGRFGRYVAGGKSPNQAVAIAWRLTEDQYGQRPTSKEQT